jgi:hypothetical protein
MFLRHGGLLEVRFYGQAELVGQLKEKRGHLGKECRTVVGRDIIPFDHQGPVLCGQGRYPYPRRRLEGQDEGKVVRQSASGQDLACG